LLRRHEHAIDVLGGNTGLSYPDNDRMVDGIVVPVTRRVYATDADYRKIAEPLWCRSTWGTSPSIPCDAEETTELTAPLYYEDLAVGQTFGTGTFKVEPDMIKAFAAEFDPQPFHLDQEAARASLFGGLVASGWHTAAVTMRLLVRGELQIVGGLIGLGAEELRWPRPVHPGDVLRVESEVVELRPSNSNPSRGLVRVRNTTLNQDSEPVMVMVVTMIVPRRPS
jgi:acyl dehydratase